MKKFDNLNKCNTGIEQKKANFSKFIELVKNQFWHGGDKYKLNDEKEFTDGICECFPGQTGIDWVLGTAMKYLGRYKNFGREKDLLKIATYMYILWLKGSFHLSETHDEDIRKNGDKLELVHDEPDAKDLDCCWQSYCVTYITGGAKHCNGCPSLYQFKKACNNCTFSDTGGAPKVGVGICIDCNRGSNFEMNRCVY